jgi:hypothetical protein
LFWLSLVLFTLKAAAGVAATGAAADMLVLDTLVLADTQVLVLVIPPLRQLRAQAQLLHLHMKALHQKDLVGSHFGVAVTAAVIPKVAIKKLTKTASNEERYYKPRRSNE